MSVTKLTRNQIEWKSGAMLGWNSSGRMDGIMRHLNTASGTPQHGNERQDLFQRINLGGSTDKNRILVSSFFPQNGGTGKGGNQRPATARPRVRKHYFEPQKDFSPEFLEYLRSLSKRDFEHAVEQDTQNNNVRKTSGTSIDKQNSNAAVDTINTVSAIRSRSRLNSQRKAGGNVNLIHGFQFFGSQTSPTSAALNGRPSTVPRYLSRKDGGRRGDQNPRSFLRTGQSPSPSPTAALDENGNCKGRPLTKMKVTPSQTDTSGNQEDTASIKVDQQTDGPASYSSSFTGSMSDSERPSSSASSTSKRVTFAADVVNYDRESKPAKKRKFPKRRRQGFPHPSRGIFVPPELEIVESSGPTGSCKDNPYLNFNQVWTHPAARSSGESGASRIIRQERFHRLMNDLEHAHIHYNRLVNVEQNDYLINAIFKRYILVLDLALTEGHLTQVEHLLETISKSIPVLQQNTFYYLYGPKIINDMDQNNNSEKKELEHPDLVLAGYALSRISGSQPRQETTNMSIETVLVKLCLELVELVFSQYGSFEFRNALSTIPFTVRQAITLLKELRTSKDAFCYIKWINNSAVQRDYRSIMKNLGLLDRYGCKAELGGKSDGIGSKSKIRRSSGHLISKRSKPLPKPIPEMVQQSSRPPSRSSSP